ncbi:MAG: IPT/TIG domain-containing protein [Planctomycetota bacterium]|nr:hypothetical protein [Planctomycetota bacterium]
MKNTLRLLLLALAIPFLLTSVADAQTIERVRPLCGTEGDAVLICGSGFSEEPTVLFNDIEADVVRNSPTKILCRVPEGVAVGPATIDADGATASFDVLEPGSPVVLHLSTKTMTPGLRVFVIGRRLGNGEVAFVDGDSLTVDSVRLHGRRRIAYFEVPGDIAPGTYTLLITNGEGLDTGACSPKVEVVEAGDPTLDDMQPEEQLPGRPVLCEGTNLAPPGLCRVHWTDSTDRVLTTLGLANGFNKVYTRVPHDAVAGETYGVVIDLRGGATTEGTGVFRYLVGTPPVPVISEIRPDAGPAGSIVKIRGEGLAAGFAVTAADLTRPKVEFGGGGVAHEAKVLAVIPGFGIDDDTIVAQVPGDLADGDYDVTVTTSAGTSNAVVFSVKDLPLTVTSMEPNEQGAEGPKRPVIIEGSGFGVFNWVKPSLAVTWDDGDKSLRGYVLFHTDSVILVIPPGGRFDPLPVGEYRVTVITNPGSDEEESAEAGIYTVE